MPGVARATQKSDSGIFLSLWYSWTTTGEVKYLMVCALTAHLEFASSHYNSQTWLLRGYAIVSQNLKPVVKEYQGEIPRVLIQGSAASVYCERFWSALHGLMDLCRRPVSTFCKLKRQQECSSKRRAAQASGSNGSYVCQRLGRNLPTSSYLDSQVAGNYRPLYPKVDHYWFKVAHNHEPLALQVE